MIYKIRINLQMIKLLIIFLVMFYITIYIYPFTVVEKLPYKIEALTYYMGIPLLIHRTYKNRYTHQKMLDACHKKWLDLNPNYQVRWYTDKQCELFIKDFSTRIYNVYKIIKPGAFKADIWRLCILYKYGGVYVDAHTTPFKPMSYIMKYIRNQEHNFISVLDCKQSGRGIHNGFMITSQQHPFLKQCIDDIVEIIENRSYTDNVLAVTGPLCLSRSVHKVLETDKSFCEHYNYYGNLTFYLLKFEWGISQYISDRGNILMSKKYNAFEYFYDKIIKKKKGYSYIWKNKLLY